MAEKLFICILHLNNNNNNNNAYFVAVRNKNADDFCFALLMVHVILKPYITHSYPVNAICLLKQNQRRIKYDNVRVSCCTEWLKSLT
jgi:hypothetical protein